MAEWSTMQQLQFVELDDGGRLVLAAEDGTRYAVPVEDRLRAALRPRPTAAAPDRGSSAVGLREVQSMIRAGQSAEEVAAATGWEVERVRRFEGPVLAEQEHVIGLARRAPVRAQGRTDGSHTLDSRLHERLRSRDVDVSALSWDAARSTAQGPWTVQVIFTAGGRERRAAWHYDLATRGLESLDDEARWLSEDEQALPGGLAGHPLLGSGHGEDEVAADLMATMRERRQRRSRRPRKERENESDPGHIPGQQAMPSELLPLEDLPYDPDTMGDPPAAHPGGAAPDSPAPPTATGSDDPHEPDQDGSDDAQTSTDQASADQTRDEADEVPTGRSGKAPRQARRRLRLPKLPEPVDPPVEEQEAEAVETYARLRHPDEVSFDEFFDIDEDDDAEDVHDGQDLDPEEDLEAEQAEHEHLKDATVTAIADDTHDTDEAGSDPDSAEDTPDAEADPSDDDDEPEPEDEETPEPEPEQEVRPAGRKGRTSVPSWDDIMFGARDRG